MICVGSSSDKIYYIFQFLASSSFPQIDISSSSCRLYLLATNCNHRRIMPKRSFKKAKAPLKSKSSASQSRSGSRSQGKTDVSSNATTTGSTNNTARLSFVAGGKNKTEAGRRQRRLRSSQGSNDAVNEDVTEQYLDTSLDDQHKSKFSETCGTSGALGKCNAHDTDHKRGGTTRKSQRSSRRAFVSTAKHYYSGRQSRSP